MAGAWGWGLCARAPRLGGAAPPPPAAVTYGEPLTLPLCPPPLHVLPCPACQVWAQMEEDLGFLQRAAELRSFSMQERVEVVKPSNFATTGAPGGGAPGLLAPIFGQIAKWFQRYEAEGAATAPDLPELLPVEVAVPAAETLPRRARRRG